MLPVNFSYRVFFYIDVVFFYSQLHERFLFYNHESVLNFFKCFFFINWDYHIYFVIYSINGAYYICWLCMLTHPCILGVSPTWLWYITLLMYCWCILNYSHFLPEILWQPCNSSLCMQSCPLKDQSPLSQQSNSLKQ